MWNIYGNQYDLTAFIDKHPGGSFIINKTKGLDDITLLFETYHSFTNRTYIMDELEKYRINKNYNIINYDYKQDNIIKMNQHEYGEYETNYRILEYENGNYNKLINIIKQYYPTRFHIKASPEFIICNISLIILYFIFFYLAMFSDYNIIFIILFAIIAGFIYSILTFNLMHNSSHYALSTRSNVNIWICKIINGFSLWNTNMWFYNHVYTNHMFIENKQYKFMVDNKNNMIKISTPTTLFVTKNYFGKKINMVENTINKHINIRLPSISDYDICDISLMIGKYVCLYYGGIIASMFYSISFNSTYYYNIWCYNDTNVQETKKNDDMWLIDEIYNYEKNILKRNYWIIIFNNINYKIEHYLFPNICSEHYPKISFIVKKFCYENRIPYSIDSILVNDNINKYL